MRATRLGECLCVIGSGATMLAGPHSLTHSPTHSLTTKVEHWTGDTSPVCGIWHSLTVSKRTLRFRMAVCARAFSA